MSEERFRITITFKQAAENISLQGVAVQSEIDLFVGDFHNEEEDYACLCCVDGSNILVEKANVAALINTPVSDTDNAD